MPFAPRSPQHIPTYTIDLSSPASSRYLSITKDFKTELQALQPMVDKELSPYITKPWLRKKLYYLLRILLRKMYTAEETLILKSMSRESRTPLWVLILLNVLLDLVMGCTSGGVLTKLEEGREVGAWKKEVFGNVEGSSGGDRMLHFRTSDGGMDELRKLMVVLEYVRSDSKEPFKVLARSVTFVGFLGVLTGVREGLSVTFNARHSHYCSTTKMTIHQVLVLLGIRPTIAHHLYQTMLPDFEDPQAVITLQNVKAAFCGKSAVSTAPCYLVFSDGYRTIALEKNRKWAIGAESTSFIAYTNHDQYVPQGIRTKAKSRFTSGIFKFLFEEGDYARGIKDSKWRFQVVEAKWKREAEMAEDTLISLGDYGGLDMEPRLKEEVLRDWVTRYPTMNTETQFGCLLDPKMGEIRFLEGGRREWVKN